MIKEILNEEIKKVIKCKQDGYKVTTVNGKKKCVKMSPDEIRARKIAAKKAALKRKAKGAEIAKKAAKTKKKNVAMNIKRVVKKIG